MYKLCTPVGKLIKKARLTFVLVECMHVKYHLNLTKYIVYTVFNVNVGVSKHLIYLIFIVL